MVTNALSPMRVVEALDDLVAPDRDHRRDVLGSGQRRQQPSGGYEVYRASKAALNTLMRSFAARHAGDPRTHAADRAGLGSHRHGRPQARLSIEESIPNLVDVDRGAARASGGLQYLDYLGRTVPW